MKTISKFVLLALLMAFVGGCQKQNKIGEAFVVLKSGEVIYMADMEVVCLKPSFKSDFSGWKTEYESQDKSLVRGIETGNPTVKAKLKEIDDGIAELNAKIGGMSGDEKKISDNLAHAIEAERDKLVAQLAARNDVREEYKQIVEPIEKRIKELEAEVDKIRQEQNALQTETIQKINAYIVESKLTVPKLKPETAESLFKTDTSYGEYRSDPISFSSDRLKPFFVERRPDSQLESCSYWVFLVNIPRELEESPIAAEIKAAYQQSQQIAKRLGNANDNLDSQKSRRDEQLIPWQNRHGITQSEGQNLVELEVQQKAVLARLNEQLNGFKAGGAEARALVQEEIRKRLAELNESLSSLRRQREDFLQEAAENAKKELKAEYRQKFFELIRKDAAAAVRTGSKGDFIVSGEATYLFAQTQRDNGEKLAWLVRVDPNSPKIKMSLSNAASAGSGDFDDFWMLHWTLTE